MALNPSWLSDQEIIVSYQGSCYLELYKVCIRIEKACL